MESKKSFGEYLRVKRKELNLTQKEFADKLFVTESAVSKWERGLSYPDVTLIRDICATLGISEHELLTASEDVEGRNQELLAKKYMSLIRRFKGVQIIIYGLPLITCFICNLAIGHNLSWFFIVLTAEMTGASLTLLPVMVQKKRGLIALGGFMISLILLLMTCAIYTGGDWFAVAVVAVIFGMAVVFLPFVLKTIWLPEPFGGHRVLISFLADTVLLLVLLLVCAIYTGGDWFLVAVTGIIFGLAVAFLPFVLKGFQLPKPIRSHKTLLCFAADTVLLFVLLVVSGLYMGESQAWFKTAFAAAGYSLLLPWAMMLIIRYLPINGLFKTAGCLAVSVPYFFAMNNVFERLAGLVRPLQFPAFNFSDWTYPMINDNGYAIIFFTLSGLAVIFAVAGVGKQIRSSRR